MVGRAGEGLSQLLRALRLYNRRPRIKKKWFRDKERGGWRKRRKKFCFKEKGKENPIQPNMKEEEEEEVIEKRLAMEKRRKRRREKHEKKTKGRTEGRKRLNHNKEINEKSKIKKKK